jgi:hypothetical protein
MNAKPPVAVLSCLCVLGLLSAPASAEWITEYDPLYGTSAGDVDFYDIDETSTTDPTPLFGEPTRVGNELRFYPTNFSSESSGGMADTTAGRLRMHISTWPGTFFEKISVTEYGDYLLSGAGGVATQANVGGTLYVINETPGAFPTVVQVALQSDPTAPYTLPDPGGLFSVSGEIDLTGFEWTELYLIFTDTLQTTSEDGTVSYIQKNYVRGPVALTVIPEPGCLCLLLVGAAAAVGCKRRR